MLELQALAQSFGLSDLVPLPRRQDQAQRIAQGIDTQVDLGTEATTTVTGVLLSLSAVFFALLRHKGEPERWCHPG